MKTIFGAIAITLAVPAIAQTAPLAELQAKNSPCQTSPVHQQDKQNFDVMHKACRDTMKHHARMHRKAKTEAEKLDAEFNGNGHQGHNH